MNSRRINHIGRGTAVAVTVVLSGGGAVAVATPAGNGAMHGSTVLEDINGNQVGNARFTEDATGAVHVNVHVEGMSAGPHGIHIHSIGSCSNGFADAGSHHNPGGSAHGNHAGDLPNLVVNGAGQGHLNATVEHFSFGDEAAIFDSDGSALVVHALPDDFVTQPTGGSGARIACGIIRQG
jgi:Cu-Zn family superoxide dismutase